MGAPVDCIDRTRLFRRLDRATRRGVVMLQGHAGSGKTVLVHSWLASRGYSAASCRWLDCSDDTTVPQVQRAFAALSGHGPVRGRPPVVVVDRLDEARPTLPDEILEVAAQHPEVRLIVCSRSWPDMRIGLLAAQGELTVIGADELAFTVDEVSQLWQLRRGSVDAESAQLLWEFSQGWPVIAQITASSMATRVDDPRLRTLASFYREQMLEPLTRDDLTALEAVAVTDWSTPPLVAAITGLADAPYVLDSLIRQGLPLSWDETGRLIMHPAFRRHLITMQSVGRPDALADARWRAAVWLAEQGEELAALRLAVAGGHEALAMDLLKQEFLRRLFSNTSELAEVLAAMPAAWQSRHRYIPILQALAQAAHTGANLGAVLAVVAEHLPPDTGTPEVTLEALTTVAIRLAQRRLADGAPDLALEEGDRMNALLPYLTHAERLTMRAELALFHGQYGENLILVGRLTDAKRALVTGHALAQLARLDWVALEAAGSLALVEALMGQVAVAAQLAEDAIELAVRLGLEHSTLVARAHLAQAVAALLTTAGPAVALQSLATFDACYLHQQREFGGLSAYLESTATLLGGDQVGAMAVVAAYRRTHRSATGSLAEALLSMATINGHLAVDDIDAAQRELDLLRQVATVPEVVGAEIFEARLLMRTGDLDGAWAVVRASLAAAGPLHPGPALIQLTTAGLIAHLVGEHEQEVALSARAVALADRTGMHPGLLTELAHGAPSATHNPLTEAERVVLASLQPDDTIAAAARRMLVSVNTYKTHLRKSYRKLAVSSREEAVAKARAVGWI